MKFFSDRSAASTGVPSPGAGARCPSNGELLPQVRCRMQSQGRRSSSLSRGSGDQADGVVGCSGSLADFSECSARMHGADVAGQSPAVEQRSCVYI